MIAEINAAIQSAKALNDLLKATRELRNANEFAAAINEVSTKLTQAIAIAADAKEKELTLLDRMHQLEKENMELKDWKREAERYQLTELAPRMFAFTNKPGMERGEPAHSLCTNCFTQGQKSILNSEGGRTLSCHRCKLRLHLPSQLSPADLGLE